MSLLNAALAFGALAFSIPLIIHLFFRSRFKTVDWGAMYLLENVVRTNRRRMQLTNLLLLLLRCLIPIILAFLLARPVWNGLQKLAGDEPRTLILAVDDSRSMSAIPPGGKARIEVAKEELRSVLDDLSRRDEIILVRSSRLGAVPATMGVSDALSELRKLDARGGTVAIGQLLDAAINASAEATHARRQILVVSDFQQNGIDAATLDAARRQAEINRTDGERPREFVIDMLNVGDRWEDLVNVSIDDVQLQTPVVVGGRAAVFAATIRNASSLPANDLRLVWSIDGKPLEPRVISIEAKSTATNRLTHTIDRTGTHEITATIDRADGLMADNRRSIAVDVIDEVDVLLVDGAPSKQPLNGQADFLAISLSPFAFGGDDRPDPVHAAVVGERKLVETLTQNNVRVLILAGVGKLSEQSRERITRFVHEGGSLIVFDGPDVKPDLYNQAWTDKESTLSFPAELGDLVESEETNESGDPVGFAFDKPANSYQPWRLLSRGDDNPLSDASLSRYRKLTLRDDADDSASTGRFVLLRAANGDPLCVMDTRFGGAVVQFAFSGTDRWSNLPLRPVFLPLVQQMVLDLAGRKSDTVLPVGQPIVIAAGDLPKLDTESDQTADVRWTVRTPSDEFPVQAPTADDPIRITATYTPGLYVIEKRVGGMSDAPTRDAATKETANTNVTRTLRIASVDASESLLEDSGDARIAALAEILDAKVYPTAAELRSEDRLRSFGREIWRWLLVLLLIALVAELWLQQNLVARRSGTSVNQTGATP